MSFNAGAAALESARTNAEAAAAARVVFRTLRAALAHGLRAGGLLHWAPRRCATAPLRLGAAKYGGGSMRRHARWTGSGRHRFDDHSLVQQQIVEEKERRNEVEAIFRMMDTNSDGYLSVEESHRLGKLLGVPVPERHSVHVRGVSLHQFMGWVFGLAHDHISDEEHQVLQFYIFMKDRRGFIVRDEMRQWLDRIKLQCTDAELDELMEVMNSSSDDRGVCFEDLLQFYQAQRRR